MQTPFSAEKSSTGSPKKSPKLSRPDTLNRRSSISAQEQPATNQFAHQRSAECQRITKRLADRALLDAYVEAGLDAEVRRYFRSLPENNPGRKPTHRKA